jgi:hypothetical protein
MASSSLMLPLERALSMAICLPGIASRVNRAATSATLRRPLGDHQELHGDQNDKDDDTHHQSDDLLRANVTPPVAGPTATDHHIAKGSVPHFPQTPRLL